MFGLKRKPKQRLDATLLNWSRSDAFTVRDLLNGGVAVFGRSGSGKTSSSGKAIGRAIVNYRKSGGLILAAKPDDAVMWEAMFKAAGREDDLIVFGVRGESRFDILDYELKCGGDARSITRCIMTIGETLRSSDAKGGGEDGDFWEKQQERRLYNAVVPVMLALGRVTAPDLQRFISDAASTGAMVATEQWQAGFQNQILKRAFEAKKTPIEKHDLDLALEHWLRESPVMADRTRSSIDTGVMGILHTFNTGIVRELLSTETNCSPDDMMRGKWILVNAPPALYGDSGNFINAAWKYQTQRAVLRRHAQEGDCINVIWCDEAQQFVNSHDAHYLAQCRSHLGCMVFLTQSLHSYYSALKGMNGRHQADALLSNFHTKIFHALGDVQTAEWASNLVGKSLQTFVGGSMPPEEDVFGAMMGFTRFTGSFSEHFENILQPNVFLGGMRTGGPSNGYVCDAIIIRSGEKFSNGESFLQVAFSQQ